MAIVEKVRRTIAEALKARDLVRLDAARMAQAALKNRQIEKGSELDETEAQKVIATLIKQHRESIEQYQKANREELAKKEEEEKVYLESLLPPPLSETEIAECIARVIAETGASEAKDMGKVMKPVMAELGPRADGAVVRKLVQEKLGNG